MEIWVEIAGFPQYEVSNKGRVRSWRRRQRKWRNPQSDWQDEPTVLAGSVTPFGYTAHILRKQGQRKPYRRLLHRLMAQAFIPNPLGLSDVAHNDGDPKNNTLGNLRWASHRENQIDMRRHGTMQDGERCCTAKISEEAAKEILRRSQTRGEGIKLAAEFGLSRAQISRIKNGSRWSYL